MSPGVPGGEWGRTIWPAHYQNNIIKNACYLPVSIACDSFDFHNSATSFASGSSGLGALNKACMESNTVRIWRAGLHLSKNCDASNLRIILEKTKHTKTLKIFRPYYFPFNFLENMNWDSKNSYNFASISYICKNC